MAPTERSIPPEPDDRRLAPREVVVHEPQLSDDANAALTHDLLDVVGRPVVSVPADRPYANLGEGEDAPHSSGRATLSENRFIIGQVGGVLIVVGTIVALVTGNWWLLPLAVAVLGLGTALVIRMVLTMTSHDERPSASTVAMLEEEGVEDPESLFSDIVDEFADPRVNGGRRVSVENERRLP